MPLVPLAVAAVLLTAQTSAPASPSFCARLAPELGMWPINPTIVGGERINEGWRLNLFKGLSAIFGGSRSVGFSIRPIGEWSDAEFERLNRVCNPTKKGVLCTVNGPARFGVKTKGGEVKVDATASERATVELRDATITCRDLPVG